jgi:hypothetical protein
MRQLTQKGYNSLITLHVHDPDGPTPDTGMCGAIGVETTLETWETVTCPACLTAMLEQTETYWPEAVIPEECAAIRDRIEELANQDRDATRIPN